MRRKAKRDANEAPIVEALTAMGFEVYRLNDPGLPDLIVWRRSLDRVRLVEVKNPHGRGRRLTARQRQYTGPREVITSVDEALSRFRQL